MATRRKLSVLVTEIQEAIEAHFEDDFYWVIAEITDVKKHPQKQWCFLKLIEKRSDTIDTEIKAVFWNQSYKTIATFEKLAQQAFEDGLEITCCVKVKFHKKFGLSLEIVDIDANYTIGKLAQEKDAVLAKLVAEYRQYIQLIDSLYITYNNQLPKPKLIKRIALITAPNSDGQRDFIKEIRENKYGLAFTIDEYLVTVQGETASTQIIHSLQTILNSKHNYDVVAIVRGGGSQTDFKPFDHYALAAMVASFPIPIYTGIGHDRNTSVVDLMATQLKTPTKVAAHVVDINFLQASTLFQYQQKLQQLVQYKCDAAMNRLLQLKENLHSSTQHYIVYNEEKLQQYKRLIKSLSIHEVLKRGFALLEHHGNIITNIPTSLLEQQVDIIMYSQKIKATIQNIKPNENN
jgi:exodeoxyribonuclease VII large subunit